MLRLFLNKNNNSAKKIKKSKCPWKKNNNFDDETSQMLIVLFIKVCRTYTCTVYQAIRNIKKIKCFIRCSLVFVSVN